MVLPSAIRWLPLQKPLRQAIGDDKIISMKPTQAKMARVAVKWTTDDLASAAKVGRMTVARFERGDNVTDENLRAMRTALESAGASFTDDGKRIGVTIPG